MITKNSTINEIARMNHLTEMALGHFDFRKGNFDNTIAEICEKNDMNADFFIAILELFYNIDEFNAEKLKTFPVQDIVEYLGSTHLYYRSKQIPELEQAILNLRKDYSEYNPFLELLDVFFVDYKNELCEHIQFEDENLFPYIYQLIEKVKIGSKQENDSMLGKFLEAHDDEAEKKLDSIINKIEIKYPEVLQFMSYALFERKLRAFEINLRIHARIEDEVLIEKIKELQEKL